MKYNRIGITTIFLIVITIIYLVTYTGTAYITHGSPNLVISEVETIHTNPISINITGDDEFNDTATLNGWEGNGSENYPYIIENTTIDNVKISHTTKYFIIRNNTFVNSSYIHLTHVSNGVLEKNTLVITKSITLSWYAITINRCGFISLHNNTIQSNYDIRLSVHLSSDIVLTHNSFQSVESDIIVSVYSSEWLELTNNQFYAYHSSSGLSKIFIMSSAIVEIVKNEFLEVELSMQHCTGIDIHQNTLHQTVYGTNVFRDIDGLRLNDNICNTTFEFYEITGPSFIANNTFNNDIAMSESIGVFIEKNTIDELHIANCINLTISSNTINKFTIEDHKNLIIKNNQINDFKNKDKMSIGIEVMIVLLLLSVSVLVVGGYIIKIKRKGIP